MWLAPLFGGHSSGLEGPRGHAHVGAMATLWKRSNPKYVAEVAFSEWTRDGKLRHPSFRGLRVDEAPEECIRERTHA